MSSSKAQETYFREGNFKEYDPTSPLFFPFHYESYFPTKFYFLLVVA